MLGFMDVVKVLLLSDLLITPPIFSLPLCFVLESREPGSPIPALFHKGGEEKSPYSRNFITDLQKLLDARPTLNR